nr:immunoglobulin heavy chain junction region [Mus musculus]NSM05441.1 immunoglobulin heavy chain junction region [Mus musculus]NSM05865.1 immunoglobulin heavy chain junction region [Mus musculus]NSM05989.1 immunoglobulin heavy chain junction region [Mus musculus]NSM06300.1 immunoglobulin heavy chain junction region [Mus musculus]
CVRWGIRWALDYW